MTRISTVPSVDEYLRERLMPVEGARKFIKVDDDHMAQFLALGLPLPAHHPDLKKYYSLNVRQTEFNAADLSEITLMSQGDILVLYTDGVYDGSDQQGREQLEVVMREHYRQPTREICNALLDYATQQDDYLRQNGDEALIDDKTVFIVKRTRKLPGCSATFTRS